MNHELNPICPHCTFLESCFAQYQAQMFRDTFEYLHKGKECNYQPGIAFTVTIKGADNVMSVVDEIKNGIAKLQSALNGLQVGIERIESN